MRSCTRSASALTCALESPLAITTRSNIDGMRAVLKTMDVVALDVLERLDHDALLGADIHHAVEPVRGDIVRHRGRHQRRRVSRRARTRARISLAEIGIGWHRHELRLRRLRLEARPRRTPRSSPGCFTSAGRCQLAELLVLVGADQQIERRRRAELGAQRAAACRRCSPRRPARARACRSGSAARLRARAAASRAGARRRRRGALR